MRDSPVTRWGEGLYDDDMAPYVRDRFNSALATGKSPIEAAQSIADDVLVDDGTDKRHVAVLALADLLASVGSSVPAITDEARWWIDAEMQDASEVPERDAVLVDLRDRLDPSITP
jgi:hypothetical protein